jgi:hypothetical protein
MKNKKLNPRKAKITKDKIVGFCDCLIKHKGQQKHDPSIIFCDRIEYWHDRGEDAYFGKTFDHHLMFWKGKELIFKVYLPNEQKHKDFKDIFEALKSCGIKCLVDRK